MKKEVTKPQFGFLAFWVWYSFKVWEAVFVMLFSLHYTTKKKKKACESSKTFFVWKSIFFTVVFQVPFVEFVMVKKSLVLFCVLLHKN